MTITLVQNKNKINEKKLEHLSGHLVKQFKMRYTFSLCVLIFVLTSLEIKVINAKDASIEQAYNEFNSGAGLKSENHVCLVEANKQQQIEINKRGSSSLILSYRQLNLKTAGNREIRIINRRKKWKSGEEQSAGRSKLSKRSNLNRKEGILNESILPAASQSEYNRRISSTCLI